jgi:hypothetical protein
MQEYEIKIEWSNITEESEIKSVNKQAKASAKGYKKSDT